MRIGLSVLLLVSFFCMHGMQCDDDDLSPVDQRTAEITRDDFTNLQFIHTHTNKRGCEDIAGDFHPFCYEINLMEIKAHSAEGKPVGFIKIDGDDPCYFLRLHVYQFAKGNGVGKKLLEQAVAWSKSQGCKYVTGMVFDSKRDYYQKLGVECNPASYFTDGLTNCRYTIAQDKI